MTTALRRFVVLGFVALAFTPTIAIGQPASARQSDSAALAVEFTRLLDERKLDSFAATQGERFVGALYIPGSQLLVVSGSAPRERITYLLGQKAYRDVYLDLQGTADPKTKVFVSDLGANGLLFKREENQPFDVVNAAGTSRAFDGDWGKAKISESEYTESYQTYDDEYSQMLQALLTALKKPS